ncbi:pyrimidine (deoxy)nucleoside triphosphate diphosphatase [Escherichia coli]
MAKFYSRNAPPSDQAGLWRFAGGKVELDESQRRALVRELNEELGIEATVGEYLPAISEKFGRIIHLHAWRVPDFHGTLQAHEHQALVWCSPEEALRYPLAPADIPLLEAFMALRAARPAD